MIRVRRSVALLLVTITYLFGLVVFFTVYESLGIDSVLWRSLIADGAMTLAVFLGSIVLNNSSVYDPYWSIFPPLLFAFWILRYGTLDLVSGLLLVLTAVWALRLTLNWLGGWRGLEQEDWRYREFRAGFGWLYWPVSLFAIHMVPTVSVFLASVPAYFVFTDGIASLPVAAFALVVTAGAISLETVADMQLHRFKREGGEGPCTVGLWRFSRHPNYLGELGFWFGILLFGFAANAPWWSLAGMAVMVALFLGYSIPAMERKIEATRPGYRIIREAVPALVPLPGRYLAPGDERVT